MKKAEELELFEKYAKGNKEAIIAASTLDVVQLRISNIVMEIDREEENIYEHAYIYVNGDKIVIE